MSTRSLWMESSTALPRFPRASGAQVVDVAVVGAGVTGLTAAVLLAGEGKKVAVLEAHRVSGGETGNTTAHLTELLDARYHELEKDFGRAGAALCASGARTAIERIATFVDTLGIDCDFERVKGWLWAHDGKRAAAIEREHAAAVRAGLSARVTRTVPLPFIVELALEVDDQAQLHPLRYMRGLLDELLRLGGAVFEDSRVVEAEDGEPCRLVTDAGATVTAGHVFCASNVPVVNRVLLHTKLFPYRTYALAARVARTPPPGLFFDTDEPYHYVRTHRLGGETWAIVGGEDHKTGQGDPEAAFAALAGWTRERFGATAVGHRWSGQVIDTPDGLPYIGLNSASRRTYVASGFSGTGITFGTLAAMMVSDAVLGRDNRWAALFDATRFKPKASLREYVKENLDYPAHLVGDRLARPSGGLSSVAPGEGKVISVGGKRVAVYREPGGRLLGLSATCTHLGCQVGWNAGEKSWDCPCHGGRFDPRGEVLNGPPISALERVSLPEERREEPDEEEQPARRKVAPGGARGEVQRSAKHHTEE